MLWLMALLAPFSLLMSDLPRAWAWPLALATCAWGVLDAVRYRKLPSCALVTPGGCGQPTCNGLPMQGLKIAWRGPLAFLRWRDPQGRVRRLMFWPDTLPPISRRELRLAAMCMQPAPEAASMAR